MCGISHSDWHCGSHWLCVRPFAAQLPAAQGLLPPGLLLPAGRPGAHSVPALWTRTRRHQRAVRRVLEPLVLLVSARRSDLDLDLDLDSLTGRVTCKVNCAAGLSAGRSLLALLLLSCSGGCSLWRRRHEMDLLCGPGCGQGDDADAASDRDSTASCYPPPEYSRCNSFSQPPPYSEVCGGLGMMKMIR